MLVTERLNKIIGTGFWFLLIGAIILVFVYSSFPGLIDHSEYKWPKMVGKIIQIKKCPVIIDNASNTIPDLIVKVLYKSKFKYAYQVNGKRYYTWSDEENIGTNLYVFYNPKNPGESTLEPKPQCRPLVGIIITILLLVVYLYVVRARIRRIRN